MNRFGAMVTAAAAVLVSVADVTAQKPDAALLDSMLVLGTVDAAAVIAREMLRDGGRPCDTEMLFERLLGSTPEDPRWSLGWNDGDPNTWTLLDDAWVPVRSLSTHFRFFNATAREAGTAVALSDAVLLFQVDMEEFHGRTGRESYSYARYLADAGRCPRREASALERGG